MLQWTWGCGYLLMVVILFSLDKYLEVGLLDHMVTLFFIFWATSLLFSIVTVPIHIPINSAQGFTYLHILTNTLFLIFLLIAILTGVRWYPVILICISLMISDIEHLFTFLLAICMSLEKMSIQILCSFLNWIILLLSCMNSLCILEINLSSEIYDLQIFFSHSVGCLFILLMISFAV